MHKNARERTCGSTGEQVQGRLQEVFQRAVWRGRTTSTGKGDMQINEDNFVLPFAFESLTFARIYALFGVKKVWTLEIGFEHLFAGLLSWRSQECVIWLVLAIRIRMFCYYLMHTSWCIFLLSEFINSKLFINMNADSFADQLMNSKLFINMNL